MRRLSTSIENIKPHYDVVVIGSGYGGGIAASRLARAGQRVCVLERGREIQPGEYPNNKLNLIREVQTDLPIKHVGSPTALFDIRYNDDINVVLGCGLGGTSLIGSGASLRADPRVFQDERWPVEIRNEPEMEQYYRYAEDMLKPVPYPEGFPELAKLDALEKSAAHLKEEFSRIPICTNFDELEGGVNDVGVMQRPCVGCGDCESGCNYHAKNTVLMNYLPDAANHGAEIFTQASVRYVERAAERWRVYAARMDGSAATIAISADIVILAAGTLGTTEILLRSAERGLPLSAAVGSRFSGNGDMVGWTYNADVPIHGIGFGTHVPGDMAPVGPCVSGMIDGRKNRDLEDGWVLEEGGMPGAISPFLPLLLAAGAKLMGEDTDSGFRDRAKEKAREIQSKLMGPYTGAVNHTQTYLLMVHDDSEGRMYLDDDRLRISWPDVGDRPVFKKGSELLQRASEALGGTYVPNLTWNELTGQQLLTGHPLGGAPMAEDAQDGVVNHKGQVFSDVSGSAVHQGLYVMDGAIIPRSLGANPLLTICALAERSCRHLAETHGWSINYDLPSRSTGRNLAPSA